MDAWHCMLSMHNLAFLFLRIVVGERRGTEHGLDFFVMQVLTTVTSSAQPGYGPAGWRRQAAPRRRGGRRAGRLHRLQTCTGTGICMGTGYYATG